MSKEQILQDFKNKISKLPEEKRKAISELFYAASNNMICISVELHSTILDGHNLYLHSKGNCPSMWYELYELYKLFEVKE